tara:strand:+ start:994 stop:1296 length:303 start_codon:yes stop_codon:yes gene_type:complete
MVNAPIEKLTAVLSLMGAAFATFFYLDNAHFSQEDADNRQIETQKQILNIDRARNERIRDYYENKIDSGEDLDTFEQRRLDGVKREIEEQIQKLLILEAK